jgi:hypothetical protein
MTYRRRFLSKAEREMEASMLAQPPRPLPMCECGHDSDAHDLRGGYLPCVKCGCKDFRLVVNQR